LAGLLFADLSMPVLWPAVNFWHWLLGCCLLLWVAKSLSAWHKRKGINPSSRVVLGHDYCLSLWSLQFPILFSGRGLNLGFISNMGFFGLPGAEEQRYWSTFSIQTIFRWSYL
jgi:hypothetical protein